MVAKLTKDNVSINEKRKTLQKAQVGKGILDAVEILVIPLLRKALRRGIRINKTNIKFKHTFICHSLE